MIEPDQHECECVHCNGHGCHHDDDDEESKLECAKQKEEDGCCDEKCNYCEGEGEISWGWWPDHDGDCSVCKKEDVEVMTIHNNRPGEQYPCKECFIKWHTSHAKINGCEKWKEQT